MKRLQSTTTEQQKVCANSLEEHTMHLNDVINTTNIFKQMLQVHFNNFPRIQATVIRLMVNDAIELAMADHVISFDEPGQDSPASSAWQEIDCKDPTLTSGVRSDHPIINVDRQ